MTTTFTGMPDEGLAFLEDLEERNTRAFFEANKAVFTGQVQAPFAALVEAAAARLPWLGASVPAFAVAFLATLAVGRLLPRRAA